ncbi:SapC family protein [Halovibrio sp. HP20-50]|uniref:SapC family protein n=1 Tax=Halovibrio sp. HP20-59 TaxID=3080275 RepID=UPI00294AF2C0|nr:SapC family protein [Halovibrio sp. HP20-59]MEA2120075.1 SapC family protein [Halovibrio sp. HP20-59]
MSQWIAISRTQHADSHYLPRQGYAFTINQAVAPILLAELPKLVPHYALGFIKQEAGYQAVALLSLDGQNNLYLHSDGRWLGNYVPASLRGYPFTLARSDQDQVLAIAQEHLSDDQGEPLFDEEGNLAVTVQKTLEFLNQCEQNRELTQQSMDALAEADVIEQWPLKIERGEGHDPISVNGLYRVSETALNALEADAYAKLRGGPMALAHAQLFSMSQLSQLSERAKYHAEHGATQEVPENLDSVLDGMDDEELTFDFDS